MSEKNREYVRHRYDRAAHLYDWVDRLISPGLRQKALARARGKVLELGIGTGANLPYYPQSCEITGIDFSPEMLKRAARRTQDAHVPVRLLLMDIEALNFPDQAFDTVISTFVFCSVPDPLAGLREAKRVCKREGYVILLEHMRSENLFLARFMDLLNPLIHSLVGCNINRQTMQALQEAGLLPLSVDISTGGHVRLIMAKPIF